jgi:hypothetical protein
VGATVVGAAVVEEAAVVVATVVEGASVLAVVETWATVVCVVAASVGGGATEVAGAVVVVVVLLVDVDVDVGSVVSTVVDDSMGSASSVLVVLSSAIWASGASGLGSGCGSSPSAPPIPVTTRSPAGIRTRFRFHQGRAADGDPAPNDAWAGCGTCAVGERWLSTA